MMTPDRAWANLTFTDESLPDETPQHVGAVMAVCRPVEGLLAEEMTMTAALGVGVRRRGFIIADTGPAAVAVVDAAAAAVRDGRRRRCRCNLGNSRHLAAALYRRRSHDRLNEMHAAAAAAAATDAAATAAAACCCCRCRCHCLLLLLWYG